VLAYDFPLLAMFWTLTVFFLWVAWIVIVFRVILDIFRSTDLGGAGKAFWALFVVLIPWLGVLLYLIVRGRSMAQRDHDAAVAHEEAVQSYIRQTASSGSTADELAKLSALQAQGVITEDEFVRQKAKLLS
jgi:hypothetical protein